MTFPSPCLPKLCRRGENPTDLAAGSIQCDFDGADAQKSPGNFFVQPGNFGRISETASPIQVAECLAIALGRGG
jgi:hypothetical protein